MTKFDDHRLAALNGEQGFRDDGMRQALVNALEPGEHARACYSVSAHIWVEAVLTDRALVIVKGAVRAKAIRVPLPLEVTREPAGTKKGARVRTPLGDKTLWGSKLDPEVSLLLSATRTVPSTASARSEAIIGVPASSSAVDTAGSNKQACQGKARLTRRQRVEARRAAGRKPRKPRRQRARAVRVGPSPASTIWGGIVKTCG